MKRFLKTAALILLALIILGAAIICLTQWENINAAIVGLRHSEEEIDTMKTDVKADFSDKTGIDLDVIEAMAGSMTPEGALIVDPPSAKDEETEHPGASQAGSDVPKKPGPASPRDTSEIEKILARFYALRSGYVSKIEGIKSDAYTQYKALPREARGTGAKIRIGRAAVAQATALESECDAKMIELLKELRIALRKAGMDESIAKDVEYYYASEKSLMKAQYMSKYKKYLS